ncbi:hypothetical protein AB0L40_01725 [Patulibacter sp. NPDC049589]|uniref:hypothetical protein n=1 Tax=Patulibacter sp. NPDC049589 TaxID=3154731 RepID=UPI003422D340
MRAIGEDVVGELGRPGFRGCAVMNAASEFEDPESPVRRVVAEHRQWYYELARRGFVEAGHPRPGNAARHYVMIRDGAMSAAYLDTPATARRVFSRGAEGLLKSIDAEPTAPVDDDED